MNDHLHPLFQQILFQQILKDTIMPESLTPDPRPVNAGETKDKLRILIEALVIGRAKRQHHVSQAQALWQASVDLEKQICELANIGNLDLDGKLFYTGSHAIQVAEEWFDVPVGDRVRIFEVVR